MWISVWFMLLNTIHTLITFDQLNLYCRRVKLILFEKPGFEMSGLKLDPIKLWDKNKWENPCHYCFPQMLTFPERTMKQEKEELTSCPTNKNVVLGTRNNYNLVSLHASSVMFVCTKIVFSLANCSIWLKLPTWTNFLVYIERISLSWSFVKCYALFNRVVSLWHTSLLTCVVSGRKLSLLDRCQTQIFLAVTSFWGSGKVSLLASKTFY